MTSFPVSHGLRYQHRKEHRMIYNPTFSIHCYITNLSFISWFLSQGSRKWGGPGWRAWWACRAGGCVTNEGSADEGSLARLTSAVACFLELLLQMSSASYRLSHVQVRWERRGCWGIRDREKVRWQKEGGGEKSKLGDIFQSLSSTVVKHCFCAFLTIHSSPVQFGREPSGMSWPGSKKSL